MYDLTAIISYHIIYICHLKLKLWLGHVTSVREREKGKNFGWQDDNKITSEKTWVVLQLESSKKCWRKTNFLKKKHDPKEREREREKKRTEERSSIKLVNLMLCHVYVHMRMDSPWLSVFIMQFKIYYFIESGPMSNVWLVSFGRVSLSFSLTLSWFLKLEKYPAHLCIRNQNAKQKRPELACV